MPRKIALKRGPYNEPAVLLRTSAQASKRRKETEEGSILLLLLGLCLIVLLLASVVTGITGIYLEKQKLQSLADQTASATVQTFSGLSGERGERPAPVLNSANVSAQAENFLASSGAYSQFDQLALTGNTVALDINTGQVQLTALAHPPLVSIIVPQGVQITVTARARVTVYQ